MSVKQYLEEHDTDDLHFIIFMGFGDQRGLSQEKIDELKNLSDNELVLECLDLCVNRYSSNSTNYVETCRNASRSAIDLWRHAKFFHPEISIYDVLHILYNNQNKLVGHHCCTVYRQVFRLRRNESNWILNIGDETEFGNYFSDWKNICLENDNAYKNFEEEDAETESDDAETESDDEDY